jgi:hypothetical protein
MSAAPHASPGSFRGVLTAAPGHWTNVRYGKRQSMGMAIWMPSARAEPRHQRRCAPSSATASPRRARVPSQRRGSQAGSDPESTPPDKPITALENRTSARSHPGRARAPVGSASSDGGVSQSSAGGRTARSANRLDGQDVLFEVRAAAFARRARHNQWPSNTARRCRRPGYVEGNSDAQRRRVNDRRRSSCC